MGGLIRAKTRAAFKNGKAPTFASRIALSSISNPSGWTDALRPGLHPIYQIARLGMACTMMLFTRRTNHEHNLLIAQAQEGIMARALIVGLVELGSLAIFSACVAVLAIAVAPLG